MRSLVSILLLLSLPVLAAQRPGEALIAAAPSQFAKIDDISVHYKFLGEGGPVTLLVHGGGCDLTFWELQVPALLESGSVLLLDLPGHGSVVYSSSVGRADLDSAATSVDGEL